MKLFAARDMKAQIYLKPFVTLTLADALRSFEMIANEPGNTISQFPNDFRLYHLGDFDSNTGVLTVLDEAPDLGSAADFKKRPENQPSLNIAN